MRESENPENWLRGVAVESEKWAELTSTRNQIEDSLWFWEGGQERTWEKSQVSGMAPWPGVLVRKVATIFFSPSRKE